MIETLSLLFLFFFFSYFASPIVFPFQLRGEVEWNRTKKRFFNSINARRLKYVQQRDQQRNLRRIRLIGLKVYPHSGQITISNCHDSLPLSRGKILNGDLNTRLFDSFYRYYWLCLPVASDTAGSPPRVPRWRRGGGFHGRSGGGGGLRREVSASQPSKLISFRMFRDETSFLPEQLHRQNVSGHHDDHGYVEGDQRAEHEKRSVVDHACSRPWHNV